MHINSLNAKVAITVAEQHELTGFYMMTTLAFNEYKYHFTN